MQTGKVTGYEISKNKGSTTNKLVLQLEISDPEDIQSIQLLSSSGEISNPPNGSKIVFVPIGTNGYKLGLAVDDNIEPESLEPGEKILYSSKDGEVKAKIKLTNDSKVILNDGEDFAVRYSKLEEAFNQLKEDFNTLVSNYNSTVSVFNAHVHIVTTPDTINGTASPTTTPGTNGSSSNADIAPSKVEEVILP